MDQSIGVEELLSDQSWICRAAQALVFDPSRRDDVVQEMWLKTLERPPRSGVNPRAWMSETMRRIAREGSRSESRRNAREMRAASLGTEAHERSAAEVNERAEWQKKVVDAVLGLEDPYRSTLLLRYLEERTPREIAKSEGITEATVRSRIKRGLDSIREQFDQTEKGDRRSWCLSILCLAKQGATRSILGVSLKASLACVAVSAVVLLGVHFALDRKDEPGLENVDQQKGALVSLEENTSEADDESSPSRSAVVADEGRRLFGRVMDVGSRPIAGARVEVGPDEDVTEPNWSQLAHAVTDREGQFSLEWSGEEARVSMRVTAESFAPTVRRKLFVQDVEFDAGVLILEPINGVSGRVCSSDGAPIEGVDVVYTLYSGGSFLKPKTKSKENGTFFLPTIGVISFCHLYFHKEGYGANEVRWNGQEPIDVTLKRGVTVHGIVQDNEGNPIPGAEVVVDMSLHWLTYTGDLFPESSPSSAIASLDGSFSLKDIAPGSCHFRARAPGYQVQVCTLDVEVGPLSNERLKIHLVPHNDPIMIRGTVVDADSGLPLEGVLVDLKWLTDESGFFEVGVVRGGESWFNQTWDVWIQKDEYVTQIIQLTRAGDPSEFRIELERGAHVQGLVIDRFGNPLERTTLWFEIEGSDGTNLPSATSGGNGMFEAWIKRGTYEKIQILNGGYPRTWQKGFVASLDSTAEKVIVLGEGPPLEGVVLSPEGKPMEGIEISAWTRHGKRARRLCVNSTNASGHFWIYSLPEQEVWLAIEAPSCAAMCTSVLLPSSEPITIELESELVLEGVVVDQDGNPVQHSWVIASPEDGSPWDDIFKFFETGSGEEGEYRIEGLPAIPLELRAMAPSGRRDVLPSNGILLSPPFAYEKLTLERGQLQDKR